MSIKERLEQLKREAWGRGMSNDRFSYPDAMELLEILIDAADIAEQDELHEEK